MDETRTFKFKSAFAEDVFSGLSSYPKSISSKYLYDQEGDKLFQQIMDLPEYYLTRKEFEILEGQREEIGRAFAHPEGFDLIELGAGDGKKTKILLSHFKEQGHDFKYLPVDISSNILEELNLSLQKEIPGLEVIPQQGTYKEVLENLAGLKGRKKVILFLGSNIGNLSLTEAAAFLKKISATMTEKDMFFLGVDLKKDPQTILDAYADKKGITAAFNMNLLNRMNRELQANFDLESFEHWPLYNPETGTAKSYLVSRKDQTVTLSSINLEVHFKKWETIHIEISQKYDDTSISWLAKEANLKIVDSWSDRENYFRNYLFQTQ